MAPNYNKILKIFILKQIFNINIFAKSHLFGSSRSDHFKEQYALFDICDLEN